MNFDYLVLELVILTLFGLGAIIWMHSVDEVAPKERRATAAGRRASDIETLQRLAAMSKMGRHE